MTVTFEELLELHRPAVERLVKFRIDEPADAEDVLQETYLSAFRGFSGLRGAEAFKPWILEIARRRVADFYRGRVETVPIDRVPETRLTATRRGREPMPAVSDAMDGLRDADRKLLRLFYWHELSVDEIARRLNIPQGTVKSRLHAARGRFKELYGTNNAKKVEKGAISMTDLPERLPEYKIRRVDAEPFDTVWEELPGWMIVPKLGEKLRWGLYEAPSGERAEWAELDVIGRAEVHGIEGVEIAARQFNTEDYYRTGAVDRMERRFVAQLTETHCRFLAESHVENGVRKCFTFLDGPGFLDNWGFGPDNRGSETRLRRKGILTRDGDVVTGEQKPDLQSLDVVGRYEVTVAGKAFDTVCVMDIECFNDGVASEQYVDKSGRTVLWRRFNRDDWAFSRYKKPWSQILPDNQRLFINGKPYIHWYDCVSTYVLS